MTVSVGKCGSTLWQEHADGYLGGTAADCLCPPSPVTRSQTCTAVGRNERHPWSSLKVHRAASVRHANEATVGVHSHVGRTTGK